LTAEAEAAEDNSADPTWLTLAAWKNLARDGSAQHEFKAGVVDHGRQPLEFGVLRLEPYSYW